MSQIAEELQEKLEQAEKEVLERGEKLALKAFVFFIAKPTAEAFAKLKSNIDSKKEKASVSIKSLTASGDTIKDLEITDSNIKAFEPIAKKYGVKYALKEVAHSPEKLQKAPNTPPTYMVFFKAKDESVLNMALKEFSQKELAKNRKRKAKPPRAKKDIKKEIAKNKKIIDSRPKNPINKNKNKER